MEYTENCPYCDNVCHAEFVDIEVGLQQCSPFACEKCKAVEVGPYDEFVELTEDEERTGWYTPEIIGRWPIKTAPQDGTEVWVYVAEEPVGWDDPLPAFECKAAYHPDAGWCVDKLRQVTHWRLLREDE